MFPIKYIDNNLVWNKDNEVFAYYELIPYNYSFLSAEQKFIVHDSFRQLIAQSREGKIHALQIATESSIRSMQEQSKKLVTGKLKEVAYQKIDEQTEALVSMIGDNQVDYRFFLGFKLMVTEEQLNLKNIKKSAWLTFTEFLHEVNHTLMNDFVSMPNDEINRYMKMEKLLENKISRRFKVRRLEINDFGYLMEHLYGRDGIAYEDYEYQLPKKELKKETLIKYYDLIRPTRCVIEESQRYLRLEHEDKESYVSYFTVNAIVGELDFPSSEIFYFQQQQFTFPVDTSMNVEIVENRKALTTVRNKKKELKDLDNHAYQAGSETSSNVVDALDSVDELETDLDQSKESMYKLSYVIRVSAPDLDELKRRCLPDRPDIQPGQRNSQPLHIPEILQNTQASLPDKHLPRCRSHHNSSEHSSLNPAPQGGIQKPVPGLWVKSWLPALHSPGVFSARSVLSCGYSSQARSISQG